MQRMLIGADLRPGSGPFLRRAWDLAQRLQLHVTLLHVDVEMTALLDRLQADQGRVSEDLQGVRRQVVESNLDAMRAEVRAAGLDVEAVDLEVGLGMPWQRLIEASRELGAPLLAMGTRRPQRGPAPSLGSDTREAARRVPFPMAAWSASALRSVRGIRGTPRLGVGVPAEGPRAAPALLELVAVMARRLGARVDLLLCDELPASAPALGSEPAPNWVHAELTRSRHHAHGRLAEAASSPLLSGIEVRSLQAPGLPDEALLCACEDEAWDLVVVGTGARPHGVGLGPVAEGLLEAAPCPVVLVPPPAIAAPPHPRG